MLDDLWRYVLDWWLALSPTGQLGVRAIATLVVTFVVARAAGWRTDRRLRAAHFDALFRRPWSPPAPGPADPHRLTPTRLLTGLVRVTVWGGGLWVFAYLSDWTELTRNLQSFGELVWILTAVILTALYLSRLFAEKLIEIAQASPLKARLDAWPAGGGVRDARVSGPVVAVALVGDAVLMVLVLLIAADLLRLPRATEALHATWQVVLHLFTAGVAVLIGWLGARAVRAQAAAEAGPLSSPGGFGAYAAVCVMAGAALLAIFLLAGNFPTYVGLIGLVLVVMLVWPAQHWLPDIYAGFLLRFNAVKEVRIDGVMYPVAGVGLVQTQLTAPDGPQARRNRAVLEAHLAGPQPPAGLSEPGA